MPRNKKLDKNYFINKIIEEKHDINYYIDEKEQILWKGRPKKLAYILGNSLVMMPIGLIWGFIDFSILILLFKSSPELSMLLFVIPFFAIHLTPFWIWLYHLIKAAKISHELEYVVTDKRILVFRGKEGRYVSDYMNLYNLSDATLKINIIDRILKVGDITLITDTGKELVISDIPKAKFLHSKFLGLCGDPELQKQEFYQDKVECPYCDTIYGFGEKKCPSCGSHNKGI